MLTKVLGGEDFRHLAFVREYPLLMLPKDFSGFTQAERQFMEHNARLDFLVYDKIDKHPVATIEVDGSAHGTDGQKRRDGLKNARKTETTVQNRKPHGNEDELSMG